MANCLNKLSEKMSSNETNHFQKAKPLMTGYHR